MEPEVLPPDMEFDEQAKPADFGSLMAITKSEIDMQIATAKKYPRDMTSFVRSATSMATMTDKVAGECFYRLERKDRNGQKKVIEGPSVRMAEIVVSAWGNCRAASRIIEEGDRFVVAEGAFIDLEHNTAIKCEVRRRITDKFGKRYGDDMILTTANAACSIAMRNAVTKGVPRALWEDIYNQAVRVYKGDAKTLPERRSVMVDYFKKMGVTEEQVWKKCGKRSIEAMDLDDLVKLRGIATAIKDGDCTIEQAFSEEEAGDDGITSKLNKKKEEQPTNIPPAENTEPPTNPAPQTDPLADWINDLQAMDDVSELQKLQWTKPEWMDEAQWKKSKKAISERIKELQK